MKPSCENSIYLHPKSSFLLTTCVASSFTQISNEASSLLPFSSCSDDGDPTTRPPLVVTAAVESIHFRAAQLELSKDMQVGGHD